MRGLTWLFASAALWMASGVGAQEYPTRPIRMLIPQSPGGAQDTTARIMTYALTERVGWRIVVDNRPGGNGFIGTSVAAKGAPDGYTLLMAHTGEFAVNPAIFINVPYDLERDFTPVTMVSDGPMLLIVNPKIAVTTVKAFIEMAKAKPGQVAYSSAGTGTINHLAGEWPIGWTADEGPFGEFSQISGDVKWNPIFRVKCITHRKNPIFYLLQMPWENDWLAAPVTEAAGLRALRNASVEPVAIRAPVGSCGYWTLIASIRKRPGEGKNALLALLSVAEVKLVIVTDDDIDIHNPDDVDWALTFRVQADRDLIVVHDARGKHIDPSIKAWELGKAGLPTTAKLGIDATIPEGVPKKFYKRIEYYGRNRVKLEDFL